MSKQAKRYQKDFQEPEKRDLYDVDYKRPNIKPIEALTFNQGQHIDCLRHDTMVIAIGSAGTGKTFISSAIAAELYLGKHVKQIILTRPNVEAGNSLGFLPGDLDEKYAPYIEPFKKGIVDRIGSCKFKADLHKNILPKPIGFMRGETFDDCVFLLDEGQNTTIAEMKLIITRIGERSKLFITGDVGQCDINVKENGLAWLVRQIRTRHLPFDIINYTDKDCVRSGFCKQALDIIANEV